MLSAESSDVVSPKSRGRSRVSNGSELLAGIDARSSTFRRYRDLVYDLRQHLGGNPSVTQDAILRRAATLCAGARPGKLPLLPARRLDVQQFTTV